MEMNSIKKKTERWKKRKRKKTGNRKRKST